MDEDRGTGSVTRRSKHFLAHSEGEKKGGSDGVDVSLFDPIKNKASHSTADTEFPSKKGGKTETKRL